MRLVAGAACALLLVLACHGGSGAPPDASQTGQDPPAEPPASVPPPPGETAQPPGVDLTCAERLYAFPVGPSVDGPVPCSGDVCVESAPAGMGHAFIAGERGSLWAIADAYSGASIPSFLRQEGDRWVAVCPPPGGRMVTAAYGARGDDVWIGGRDGYLAHWDGRAWIPTPSPVGGTVTAIWGDAREAFASVVEGWPGAVEGPLLRWDGATWSDTGATGVKPWGNGAGHAWALGAGGVVEWTGARWESVSGLPPGATVEDVWAPPGGDLWIAIDEPWDAPLRSGVHARVLRRESGTLVDLALPSDDGGSIRWIRGSSDGDVWAATQIYDFRSLGRILRFDGTRWSEAPRAPSYYAPHVLPDGEALVWNGKLQRLDGAAAEPPFDASYLLVQAAAAAGAGDVWLGGGSGLWRLEGRTFRAVGGDFVIAIAARAPDDVWAMTSGGDFRHWNGTTLERIDPPKPAADTAWWSMAGMAPAGGGRAWAIGGYWHRAIPGLGDCSLWRWDGGWSTIPMPVGACPTAVASGPDGDLWVAAGGDVWHRRDDGSWERHDLPAQEIRRIVVTGPSDVWAAGDGIHRYDGARWHVVSTLLVGGLAVGGADDVWAYASEHRNGDWGLWHWDGRAWTNVRTKILALALAAVGGGEVWGAGGGSVLHVRASADR